MARPSAIERAGTPGGHYAGELMFAFSTANEQQPLPMTSDQHPLLNDMQYLNDHYIESVYEAAVEAVEEAILNALVAGDTYITIKN